MVALDRIRFKTFLLFGRYCGIVMLGIQILSRYFLSTIVLRTFYLHLIVHRETHHWGISVSDDLISKYLIL